jgi:hypothetical protein
MMKTSGKITLLLSLLLIISSATTFGQNKAKAVCVAFYNLENLFDTIDDPATNDAEFLPGGANQWTSERYLTKLSHMSSVIAQLGDEFIKGGPTMIGLSEIENRGVLEDLIRTDALKSLGYSIAHFESPDRRGVDVGLLYKNKDFILVNAVAVPLNVEGDPGFKTRDQLVVTGLLDNDTVTVVVNHWPSRGNDEKYRIHAATLTHKIADSLFARNRNANIIIEGDLNDDPIDPSLQVALGAQGKLSKVHEKGLFNPMWQMYKDGIGSLAYKDSWNLFDQIILSEPLTRDNTAGWKLYKTRVFNRPFLIQPDGQYAGYPFRTFSGGAYTNGYSDHFPVFVILVKGGK